MPCELLPVILPPDMQPYPWMEPGLPTVKVVRSEPVSWSLFDGQPSVGLDSSRRRAARAPTISLVCSAYPRSRPCPIKAPLRRQ